MNNQNNLGQIQNLEKSHKDQQNFFLERITKKLKEYSKNTEITESLLYSIQDKFDNENPVLSVEEFELLGCMSYILGIDYCNQSSFQKEIIERVSKRFEFFKFQESILKLYSMIFDLNLTDTCLIEAKDKFKNKILDNVVYKNEYKLDYMNMILAVKTVISNSTLPVNMTVATDQILSKEHLTYEDIIKINSLLNRQCKFIGNTAIRNMIKLYANHLWAGILNEATERFDNTKFGIVYFDSILSAKENTLKLGNKVFEAITADFNSFDFTLKPIEEAKPVKEENKPIPTKEEIKSVGENEPVKFIFGVLEDLLKKYPTNFEEISSGIDLLLDESDYSQHIYHYLKMYTPKVKSSDVSKIEVIVDINSIVEGFEKFIDNKKEIYKSLVEEFCKPIDSNNSERIKTLINNCIKDLVLVTDDQKQYLISQVIESTIETYQHLQQILTLIEQCDIQGAHLKSYVELNRYLTENTGIETAFNNSQEIEKLQIKLSMYAAFGKFFANLLKTDKEEQKEII